MIMQGAFLKRLCIAAACSAPMLTFGQTAPGGLTLNKPLLVLTAIQETLLTISGVLLTIALICVGVAIMNYKKRWEDISTPVIGGLIVAVAPALAAFIIK
jgi:hypothetical protein